MRILVLDNYDSFTYNLVHILRELGFSPDVIRNDKITVGQVLNYERILLSPGPGVPDEAGIMKVVIRELGPTHSILGVCLGLQGIAEVYGATLYNMSEVLHGITGDLLVDEPDDVLFRGLPEKFRITHYHSWAVHPDTVPECLKVTARNPSGIIMAMSHKEYAVHGVQFHPESVMTEHGVQLISNWIQNG